MENNIIKDMLESVSDTAVFFLKNDMQIEILKENGIQDFEIGEHISAVCFSGKINLICAVAIDGKLLKSIYKVFFPYHLSPKESNEMFEELPSEIVNIVAGLSISKFSDDCGELTMSPPFKVDKNLLLSSSVVSKQIKTSEGTFTSFIFKKDSYTNKIK